MGAYDPEAWDGLGQGVCGMANRGTHWIANQEDPLAVLGC